MVRLRRVAVLGASVVGFVIATAAPSGAQQLVDAGKEGDGSGGFAFVLFALMVMIIVAAMFFMDKVRRRASERDRTSNN